MSGFAGIISLDGAMPDAQLLERMAQALAFRGPDGTHITTKPGAGFCFTFLRTGPAPQSPSQPCSLDGKFWLLGDVRLDGRSDLRRKLEQHGDEFADEVIDEELVLRAWRRWGEDALPELIGDYSFALWDTQARQLWFVRDLMGARALFYAQTGGRVLFSNTLNALRCATEISKDLDNFFVGDFLLDSFCSDLTRTAFRELSRLPAGHFIHYSGAGKRTRRFVSVPIEEPSWLKSEEEYVEEFRALLERAVLDRLPQGPASIFLSGGLDSTAIAAIAVAVADKKGLPLKMRAYTVDYSSLFEDKEGRLASTAARFIDIPIEIQNAGTCLPFAGHDDGLPLTPEPCHDPFRRLYVEQNRQISKYARIAFNGYGGDGVLTGQSWPYFVDRMKERKFWQIGKSFGGYFLKHRRLPPLRGGFRSRLHQLLSPDESMAGYPTWLEPQFEAEMHLRDRWCELRRPFESRHPWHPKAHGILNSLYLSNLLESEAPPVTGVPVECCSPLLDVRIQRFLLRIPPVPLCINKELLRRALRGLLPDEIRLRAKTPFEGDQVQLHMQKGWTPLPPEEPGEWSREFVDWDKLARALEVGPIRFPWADLRPISLAYWLRAIES